MIKDKLLENIPKNYNYKLHLLFSNGFSLVTIILSSLMLVQLSTFDILSFPIFFIFLLFFEYMFHKNILHKNVFPKFLFKKHELEHHVIYKADSMEISSYKELYYVLIPYYAGLMIVLLNAPLLLLNLFFNSNLIYIWLICSMSFFMLYEFLHMVYHLPESSKFKKLKIVQMISRSHTKHHNHKFMKTHNFNVTIPLFDYIFKSYKD
jgi:hypothetical protein